MIQFMAGCMVGAIVTIFVVALVLAGEDEYDRQSR